MKTKRYLLSILLALVLLALPTAVFAKELGLLTITGPGIKGVLSLDDPGQLMKLMNSGFFDQTNFMKPAPENLGQGQGYTLTSHLNLDGKMTPFIEMVYYPVEEGQPGYVHVIGRLDGTTLQSADEWNTLSLDADDTFRTLMTANNVTLQSAILAAPAAVPVEPQAQPEVQPASVSTAAPAPVKIPYLVLGSIASVLVAFGALYLMRRRAIRQRTM